MDIQKYISTAVVIDDNEKILEQHIDFKTDNETLDEVIGRYPVDGTKILIENLTVAHRVYHHLVRREYDVLVIHTGNGCVPEIANSEYKSDLADARMFGDLLAKYVSRRYGDNDTISKVRRFSDAIVDNDPEELEKALYDLFASTLSTKILDHEHAYQSAMAMLLMNLHGKYRVRLEFENGKGFMDIIMEPKVPLLPNIVIELKRLKSEESVDRLIPEAKAALEQIHDRDYIFGMKGRIFLYGIAFKGMEAKVLSETLSR